MLVLSDLPKDLQRYFMNHGNTKVIYGYGSLQFYRLFNERYLQQTQQHLITKAMFRPAYSPFIVTVDFIIPHLPNGELHGNVIVPSGHVHAESIWRYGYCQRMYFETSVKKQHCAFQDGKFPFPLDISPAALSDEQRSLVAAWVFRKTYTGLTPVLLADCDTDPFYLTLRDYESNPKLTRIT